MSVLEASEEELEDMDLVGYGPDDFNIEALYITFSIPLMRNDLLRAIQSAKDVNIELFKAEIHIPVCGIIHKDYFAFNIIGVADFEIARDLQLHPTRRKYIVPLEDYLLFYLYDDGPIVVHESVKQKIEETGIKGIYFVPTYKRF